MLKAAEVAAALLILLVGGSVAALRIGGLPPDWEARARLVAQAVQADRLIDLDPAPEDEAGQGRGGRGGDGGRGRGGDAITAVAVALEPPLERVEAIGTGRAARSVVVTAPVPGVIERVHFASGETVEAGAPLVTLEREAEAIALDRAGAQLDAARVSAERTEQLSGEGRAGLVPEARLEEARTALALAEADRRAARHEYDRRVVRAPFAGRVGLDDVAEGEFLAAGDALVTLDDAGALRVEFLVPEGKAALLREGAMVEVATPSLPGRTFEGRVAAVDSRVDPETRTVRARAELSSAEGALRPGMTFSVSLRAQSEPVPVVPALALQWSRDGAFVWRLSGEGVERVPVALRKREGDAVFVEADLAAGDLVAVEGAQKLDPGSTVEVVEAGPEAAAATAVRVEGFTLTPTVTQ